MLRMMIVIITSITTITNGTIIIIILNRCGAARSCPLRALQGPPPPGALKPEDRDDDHYRHQQQHHRRLWDKAALPIDKKGDDDRQAQQAGIIGHAAELRRPSDP